MTRERRLGIALGLNLTIVAVQIVGSAAAHSVGLLADAGHNLADAAAIVVAWLAVLLARRPPSERHPFGWHRSTILAAQANAASLLVVSVVLIGFAAARLASPAEIHGGIVVVVASLGLVVNLLAAWILGEGAHDINVRAVILHLVGDAVVSAGVVLAGLLIWWNQDLWWLDPTVALVISLVIGWQAVRLLVESADILLESTPADVDLAEFANTMQDVAGVETVHDLHVWALSSEVHALSAHLVLEGHPTLEEAQRVGEAVKRDLDARYGLVHATLELECEPCEPFEVREASERP